MNNKPFGKKSSNEKAQNFKEAYKKLINYIKPFTPLIIIAVVLAIASSILSIMGPNKLKAMTNIIADGLVSGIKINKLEYYIE